MAALDLRGRHVPLGSIGPSLANKLLANDQAKKAPEQC